jgi:hypothetical protein
MYGNAGPSTAFMKPNANSAPKDAHVVGSRR